MCLCWINYAYISRHLKQKERLLLVRLEPCEHESKQRLKFCFYVIVTKYKSTWFFFVISLYGLFITYKIINSPNLSWISQVHDLKKCDPMGPWYWLLRVLYDIITPFDQKKWYHNSYGVLLCPSLLGDGHPFWSSLLAHLIYMTHSCYPSLTATLASIIFRCWMIGVVEVWTRHFDFDLSNSLMTYPIFIS